jgi:acetoin utilization deacetylase AcuC-like enzyme
VCKKEGKVKVIYHERYKQVYDTDPAAAAGRMEAIVREIKGFDIIRPAAASIEDISLCHTQHHISDISRDSVVFEMALLSAGGAIEAAERACAGEPSFALIRPPGHHASADSCWGFCFFNNIAIAISRLIGEKKIASALVLDFDLHYGDGTSNLFGNNKNVVYFHPEDSHRQEFTDHVERFLSENKADIIAVSAGFDRHVEDWGMLLTTEDYRLIGKEVKKYAEANCGGKRFGVLEGGYNHSVLGKNVRAFLEGMA